MYNLGIRFIERFSELTPEQYIRYVDDIFLIVEDLRIIEEIKIKLIVISVLKFTNEIGKDNRLVFLDCLSIKLVNQIITPVYAKETSRSDYLRDLY